MLDLIADSVFFLFAAFAIFCFCLICLRIELSLFKCVFSCAVKLLLWVNLLPQPGNVQMYGFSPVWVRRCVLRLKSNEKHFAQTSHLNGFSPVWTSWCLFNFELSRNRLPHPSTAQTYCLSPWVIMCFRSELESWNILPHPGTFHCESLKSLCPMLGLPLEDLDLPKLLLISCLNASFGFFCCENELPGIFLRLPRRASLLACPCKVPFFFLSIYKWIKRTAAA